MQKMCIELVDDLDGTVADETVTFGLDGVEFEIDLNEENAETLRATLSEYVQRARRTGGRQKSTRKRAGGSPASEEPDAKVTAQEIRAWLEEAGRSDEISPRGRVPSKFYAEYADAQAAA